MITKKERAHLRELVVKTTPKTWFYTPETTGTQKDGSKFVRYARVSCGDEPEIYDLFDIYNKDNFQFIAAANPETITRILDTIDRMEGVIRYYGDDKNYTGMIDHGDGMWEYRVGPTPDNAKGFLKELENEI